MRTTRMMRARESAMPSPRPSCCETERPEAGLEEFGMTWRDTVTDGETLCEGDADDDTLGEELSGAT